MPQAPTIGSATNLSGVANGSSPQIAVTWTDPANNGGSAITGYTVTSSPAGGTCTVAGATATTCTVTSGLTAGTSYTFTVKATNAAGSSVAERLDGERCRVDGRRGPDHRDGHGGVRTRPTARIRRSR